MLGRRPWPSWDLGGNRKVGRPGNCISTPRGPSRAQCPPCQALHASPATPGGHPNSQHSHSHFVWPTQGPTELCLLSGGPDTRGGRGELLLETQLTGPRGGHVLHSGTIQWRFTASALPSQALTVPACPRPHRPVPSPQLPGSWDCGVGWLQPHQPTVLPWPTLPLSASCS